MSASTSTPFNASMTMGCEQRGAGARACGAWAPTTCEPRRLGHSANTSHLPPPSPLQNNEARAARACHSDAASRPYEMPKDLASSCCALSPSSL